jgi:outer membrane protein OmpA-like peptidoglycan-associated protein
MLAIVLALVAAACVASESTPSSTTSTTPEETTTTNSRSGVTTTLPTTPAPPDLGPITIECTPGSGPNFGGLEQEAPDFDDRSLRCAVFDDGVLDGGSFVGADLTGAGFRGTEISAVRFNKAILAGADFTDATLSRVRFGGTDLRGAVFDGVDLSSVRWSDTVCPDGVNSDAAGGTCESNLTPLSVQVDVTDQAQALAPIEFVPLCAPDSGDDMSGQVLDEADFRRTDLRCASFENAQLTGADFSDADASAAVFDGADLTDPLFDNVSLFGASFAGTTIERGKFKNANLIGADLTDVVISNTRWVNTICPNGVNSDNAGGTCLGSRNALDLPEVAFSEISGDDITVRQGDGITTYTIATDVLFGFNSDTLTRDAEEKVLLVIASIAERFTTDDQIEVWGHADAIGEPGYNLELSQRRADNVAELMAADPALAGFDIEAIGLGESQPIASNTKPDGSDNPEGRALNRRVEIVVRTG